MFVVVVGYNHEFKVGDMPLLAFQVPDCVMLSPHPPPTLGVFTEPYNNAKAKDFEKFQGLADLPPISEALADKYSKFGTDGIPTADKDGNALEGKAVERAKKDVEKAAKVRAPLQKKLEDDPFFLEKLKAEVDELASELADL